MITTPSLLTPLYWISSNPNLEQHLWRLGVETRIKNLLNSRGTDRVSMKAQALVTWLTSSKSHTDNDLVAVSNASDRSDVCRWIGRAAAHDRFGQGQFANVTDAGQELVRAVVQCLLDSWNDTGWNEMVPDVCQVGVKLARSRQMQRGKEVNTSRLAWSEIQEDMHSFFWTWKTQRLSMGPRDRNFFNRKVQGGRAASIRQGATLLYVLGMISPEKNTPEGLRVVRSFMRGVKVIDADQSMDPLVRSLEERERLHAGMNKKKKTSAKNGTSEALGENGGVEIYETVEPNQAPVAQRRRTI